MAVSSDVRVSSPARTGDEVGRIGPSADELLEMVGRIGAHAGTTASVGDVLDRAVAEVAQTAQFAVGHAYRLNGSAMVAAGQSWWVRDDSAGSIDFSELRAVSERLAFPAGVGLPGQTLDRADATWIADISDSEIADGLPRRDLALACGLQSAFAFPVLMGRRVVAVLEFFGDTRLEVDRALVDASAAIGQTLGQVFERIEAHQDQWAVQTHAQMILDNAGDAYIAIDGDGIVISWNRAAERMFGYMASDAIGQSMPDLIMPPEYRADHDAGIARYKAAGHGRVHDQYVELEALRKDGERFPVEMAFWGMYQGDQWQFYSFARDITERKAREADLIQRSFRDELTGLPNRRAAIKHIDEQLNADRGDEIAVLLVDLDRFRITRDRLGHEAVDALLAQVGEGLRQAVSGSGWLARVADDEFVVVCAAEIAADLAESAQSAFAEPFHIKDDQVLIGASVGIVLATPGSDSAGALLRDVGAGMSVERESMRGAVKLFDRGRRSMIHRRLSTERDLADAIDNDQLVLYYQPVVDFSHGRIVGVEALVRWQHPRRGLLLPGSFIDVAEESGLIVPMGNWVVAEACRQAAEWRALGLPRLSVAVNLSARQFTQSGLVADIVRAVSEAGLQPAESHIVFEVTESLLMNDPVATAATLAALRSEGFGASIDDFGTGYSSLAYLKSFAVDTVKVDRSFVMDIDTDPRDRAIVAAVTELGHALGLAVLAEGIETEAQRACLAQLGCDLAQGFLFGRPMPAAQLTALVS